MTKAREVDMIFANKGAERATRLLITECLERLAGVERTVSELATLQLGMAGQVEKIVDGAGAIRAQVEKLQGNPNGDDDTLPSSAHRSSD